MATFISHFSALKKWNIPCLDQVLGRDIFHLHINEYTATTIGDRHRRKGEIHYLCTTDMPACAIAILNGEIIASPELAFLQVANKLDKYSLILLDLQMCSHPPGQPEKAITTKEKLLNFAKSAVWLRGRRKALQALKYVENGSNSIMESHAFMHLTLPHRYGGFLLKGAVMNHKVTLDEKSAHLLKQKNCYLDFFYKEHNVAVEYNSTAFHSSSEERRWDMRRAFILTGMGIKFLVLTTHQLYSKFKFGIFARMLASEIGKRLRIRSKNFHRMNEALRSLLPVMEVADLCC